MTAGRFFPNTPETGAFKSRRYSTISFLLRRHTIFRPGCSVPRAETGTGGRSRCAGNGERSLVVRDSRYCVAKPAHPGYDLPWEDKRSSICRVWLLLSPSKSGNDGPAITAISSANRYCVYKVVRPKTSKAEAGEDPSDSCSQAHRQMMPHIRRMKQKRNADCSVCGPVTVLCSGLSLQQATGGDGKDLILMPVSGRPEMDKRDRSSGCIEMGEKNPIVMSRSRSCGPAMFSKSWSKKPEAN